MTNFKLIFLFLLFAVLNSLALALPQHFYNQVIYTQGTFHDRLYLYFSEAQILLLKEIGQEYLDCGDDQIIETPENKNYKICSDGKGYYPITPASRVVFSKTNKKSAGNYWKVELRPFKFEGLTLVDSTEEAQLLSAQYFYAQNLEGPPKFLGSRIFFLPPQYLSASEINWAMVESSLEKQELIVLMDLPSFDPPGEVALKVLTEDTNQLNARGTSNALRLLKTLSDEELTADARGKILSRCLNFAERGPFTPKAYQNALLDELLQFPFLRPAAIMTAQKFVYEEDSNGALKAALILAPELAKSDEDRKSALTQKVREVLINKGIEPSGNSQELTAKSIDGFGLLQSGQNDQIYLLHLLESKDPYFRSQIFSLFDKYPLNSGHIPGLLPLLVSDDSQLSVWSAQKLETIESEELQLQMVPFLKHPKKFVAQFAFQYLDHRSLSAAVLKQLANVSYVGYSSEFVRYASLYLLSKQVQPGQEEIFWGGLQDSSPRVQKVCAQALKKFKYSEEKIPFLETHLESADVFVVLTAVEIIASIPGPFATWRLVRKSNDPRSEVRSVISRELSTGRMTRRSLEVLELDDYINNASAPIRETVIRLIGQIRLHRSVHILRDRLKIEPDPNLQDIIRTYLKILKFGSFDQPREK